MILVDTNVILDVLARREPFYPPAAALWSAVERGQAQACVSAISFNNTYYILRRYGSEAKAREGVRAVRDVFSVVPLDMQVLNLSIDSPLHDFEDAIQLHSAVRAGASHLITRDPSDFSESPVAIVTPDEYLAVLRVAENGD
jgi:predicted nucleic acid-binding protein